MGLMESTFTGIGKAIGGRKQQKRASNAYKGYEENLRGLGAVPGYKSPEQGFLDATAQTGTAASAGSAATGSLYDTGASKSASDLFYQGFDPADTRAAQYASGDVHIDRAINRAGGRSADRQEAAGDAATQFAGNIEGRYGDALNQLGHAKAGMAMNVMGMGTNVNMQNAAARNAMAQHNANLKQQMNLANQQARQQAEMYNAQGGNAYNQGQADRLYSSAMNDYNQRLNLENTLYGAKTGKNQQMTAGANTMIQGYGHLGAAGDKTASAFAGGGGFNPATMFKTGTA